MQWQPEVLQQNLQRPLQQNPPLPLNPHLQPPQNLPLPILVALHPALALASEGRHACAAIAMPRSPSVNGTSSHSKAKTGRTHWSVTVTTVDANDDLDREFWLGMSPNARVGLVADCLLDCEKTKGRNVLPRFRRVHRVLERAASEVAVLERSLSSRDNRLRKKAVRRKVKA